MYLKNAKGYLGHLKKIINMSRPEKILEMGFAMLKYKGQLVSSAKVIALNDEVTIVMKDAEMSATIKTKK
jgi:exonuclease VII large subunit